MVMLIALPAGLFIDELTNLWYIFSYPFFMSTLGNAFKALPNTAINTKIRSGGAGSIIRYLNISVLLWSSLFFLVGAVIFYLLGKWTLYGLMFHTGIFELHMVTFLMLSNYSISSHIAVLLKRIGNYLWLAFINIILIFQSIIFMVFDYLFSHGIFVLSICLALAVYAWYLQTTKITYLKYYSFFNYD